MKLIVSHRISSVAQCDRIIHISKGKVNIPELYNAAGCYGAYKKTALMCYIVGLVIQIPFLNQKLYKGPIAVWLDGADISWIVSLVVTSLLYYPLAKRTMYVPAQTIEPVVEGVR